jgi:hypothetical protein
VSFYFPGSSRGIFAIAGERLPFAEKLTLTLENNIIAPHFGSNLQAEEVGHQI